jgi:uncharacterized membrane protein
MTDSGRFDLTATDVALSAVVGAAVAVATMAISIPMGLGFLNFGEVVIYTAAFLFGGVVGGLGGGIGAAVADVVLGYAFYAPITLVAKGIEGYVVGRLAGESTRSKAIAVAAGAPFMIVAYVIARAYLEGIPAALLNELPMNIIQAVVGFAIALPLSQALQSRLPELR